ncbi:MAG: 2-iminoacetate synthase ThiH [Candidatus Margulisiibacteriota bacterium]
MKGKFTLKDLPYLLAEKSDNELYTLAEKARRETLRFFGRTIKLYAPLYLSSYCRNSCAYCNFNATLDTRRNRLNIKEALHEANVLNRQGIKHILLVSGEDPDHISVDYLQELIAKLKEKFASVSIEVQPLKTEEYKTLARAGLDGLTVYQETYNRKVYEQVHRHGQKKDYDWRFYTPDRGGQAGLREISIGFLLGLADWRQEALALAEHADFLIKKYWRSQISISFPRITRISHSYSPPYPVKERDLIQLIIALRLTFPHVDLTLSTRERPELRDKLIGVGITRMSAGSCTVPGGYSETLKASEGQFDIEDTRSIEKVSASIDKAGYEPVFKDWEAI